MTRRATRRRLGRSPAGDVEVSILGSRVQLPAPGSVQDRIERWIDDGEEGRWIVVTGYHGLWEAAQDPATRHMLAQADLWVPDGIAPILAARLRGHRAAVRIPGAELMRDFFDRADAAGRRSYFYGDTEETLSALEDALRARWPGHVVAGTHSPPFRVLTPEEDAEEVRRINEARPDVLWVGLGLPKQERWIWAHRDRLRVPVIVGVGAAFGFLSQRVRRAPPWMGHLGLEWLYRLIAEPRKVWRRSLVEGPRFLWHVAREALGRRYDDGQPPAGSR